MNANCCPFQPTCKDYYSLEWALETDGSSFPLIPGIEQPSLEKRKEAFRENLPCEQLVAGCCRKGVTIIPRLENDPLLRQVADFLHRLETRSLRETALREYLKLIKYRLFIGELQVFVTEQEKKNAAQEIAHLKEEMGIKPVES